MYFDSLTRPLLKAIKMNVSASRAHQLQSKIYIGSVKISFTFSRAYILVVNILQKNLDSIPDSKAHYVLYCHVLCACVEICC